ncbi:alpha-D-glucose phosphate-specific phosphoglucomutase [Aurantiacibacter atlanticus]|uniref:alpha-D-glucose phosphate-specific phosphoglucomutase n=1 Tax=Aurantiacibacter atlanticus TaxID=1648404 RepID=UPI00065F5A56|nr:alpha-D-glucose phosphate-specific phosphoglucomutase [Aurantiacibacter atlanticus]
MHITTVHTKPFGDQQPGTSGLRRPVATFRKRHYLENYLQSIFGAVREKGRESLVIGGDGRFFNREAIQTCIKMATASGYERLIIGREGLLSTPAASHLIRKRSASGGVIFTASHNPGGEDGDFGVKYNAANGGPASDQINRAIEELSRTLAAYRIVDTPDVDLNRLGSFMLGNTIIEIVDPVADYAALMESLFDFDELGELFEKNEFRMRFDAMHAITGPYARTIFEDRLGAPAGSVVNAVPSPDFGGGKPDPNLARARDLVGHMFASSAPDFGAASDGDGDRNMILGRNIFVTPSDSLAILAANMQLAPGYGDGPVGVARSMPTSRALDYVAEELGIPCFETPTGWKYFGNLLDAGMVTLCGEESFGTGSNHMREKDGLWAVLLWLTILAKRRQPVARIVQDHWRKYGRHYYSRHDYDAVETDAALSLMQSLRERAKTLLGQTPGGARALAAEDFSYTDPVDQSVAEHQGVRLSLEGGARIVYRLSGTASAASTLRVYLELYEPRADMQDRDTQSVLEHLAETASDLAGIPARLGRSRPSVIT